MLTRDEFIGRAADAMMRSQGLESPDLVEDEAIAGYVEMAEAALEAVGAWEAYEQRNVTFCVRCVHLSGHHDTNGNCHVSIQTSDGPVARSFETCKCAGYKAAA